MRRWCPCPPGSGVMSDLFFFNLFIQLCAGRPPSHWTLRHTAWQTCSRCRGEAYSSSEGATVADAAIGEAGFVDVDNTFLLELDVHSNLGDDVSTGLRVLSGPALRLCCSLSQGKGPHLGDSLGVAVDVGGGFGDLVICKQTERSPAVWGSRAGRRQWVPAQARMA